MAFRFPGALFLQNLVERRTLLFQLVRRDFEQRFIGSAIGWIWALIHPLVLGTGRRLFPDGGPPAELRLADTVTTTTGVIIATYHTERSQA